MISNINLELSYDILSEKLEKWEENEQVNPFTGRKIIINKCTHKNLKRIFDNFKKYKFYTCKNKKLTKIEHIIQNIFIDKNFHVWYNKNLKRYLYILTYLEFRTRELYLNYIGVPKNFENKIIVGQPFKNTRFFFYKMMKLNIIPDYITYLTMNKDENTNNSLQILYKSYYELLSEHMFENKVIVLGKDIKYEIKYIEEEFKDTNDFFYKTLDKEFINLPKYKNIKKIHNELSLFNLNCDTCGKNYPKHICRCGVNIYCNEQCKIKDFKQHYENCKYISDKEIYGYNKYNF